MKKDFGTLEHLFIFLKGLTPEQRQQPIRYWGEYVAGEVVGADVLAEDHVNPSGEMCEPISEYKDDPEALEGEPIIYPAGQILLSAIPADGTNMNFRPEDGVGRIAKERREHYEKHGRTIEYDIKNNLGGNFRNAVIGLMTGELGDMPSDWSDEVCEKMLAKPYLERVVIAGSLLAAEYDIVSAHEQSKAATKQTGNG